MKNKILEEVWKHRDAFAKQHGYDIDAMVVALRKMEREPLSTVVDHRKESQNEPFERSGRNAGDDSR